MSTNKQKEVAGFLIQFKDIIDINGLYVAPRRKNNEALIELGLTKKQRKEIIMSLTPGNFCSGPEPDRDQPGELWFFGKTDDTIEIYIKLKIAVVGGDKIAKCISFHKAEYGLNYYNY